MDILDLVDFGVDSDGAESEPEIDDQMDVGYQHGITEEQLEKNYQMLGSVAPQEKSSILLSELRVKHPEVLSEINILT